MTLTREQIEEGLRLEAADTRAMTAASHVTPEHAEYVSWLRGYGKDLLDIAARALPLPEGEPATLMKRLEEHYDFQCEGGPLKNCVEWIALKAALSRQAASLATVERERDEARKEWEVRATDAAIWKQNSMALIAAREAAEASLATAERLADANYQAFGRAAELHRRAEASLASARQTLKDIADNAEKHSGWWARETARKALSSPRKEEAPAQASPKAE